MDTKQLNLNALAMSEALALFDEETAKSVCDFTNTLWSHNMTVGIRLMLDVGHKKYAERCINTYIEVMTAECKVRAIDVLAVLDLLV